MMDIGELDRKEHVVRFDPWDCDVTIRPLSARQLCDMQADYTALQGESVGTDKVLVFTAELLSICVVDPKATAQQWLESARGSTVLELGHIVMRLSGIISDGEPEKN